MSRPRGSAPQRSRSRKARFFASTIRWISAALSRSCARQVEAFEDAQHLQEGEAGGIRAGSAAPRSRGRARRSAPAPRRCRRRGRRPRPRRPPRRSQRRVARRACRGRSLGALGGDLGQRLRQLRLHHQGARRRGGAIRQKPRRCSAALASSLARQSAGEMRDRHASRRSRPAPPRSPVPPAAPRAGVPCPACSSASPASSPGVEVLRGPGDRDAVPVDLGRGRQRRGAGGVDAERRPDREMDVEEPVAAEAGHGRLDHAQHQGHGDGRIHRSCRRPAIRPAPPAWRRGWLVATAPRRPMISGRWLRRAGCMAGSFDEPRHGSTPGAAAEAYSAAAYSAP